MEVTHKAALGNGHPSNERHHVDPRLVNVVGVRKAYRYRIKILNRPIVENKKNVRQNIKKPLTDKESCT